MAELKTRATEASVQTFLDRVVDAGRRRDCDVLSRLMADVTGCPPKMWGASIVGFGRYRYQSASGRGGEWMLTGFSPRKQNLTIYVMTGFAPHAALMRGLGTFTTGQSCLYVKRLEDLDLGVLDRILRASVASLAASAAATAQPARASRSAGRKRAVKHR